MFTGLIQELGTLKRLTLQGREAELEVATGLADLVLGESIAVMGACLTVTGRGPGSFTAFASEETLRKTGLKKIRSGAAVNVERALKVGDPLGGHLVSGHVDARVKVLARTRIDQAERFAIALPPAPVDRQIAPKGSVTVDGVSLTVNDVHSDHFEVMVIPLTLTQTTLDGTKPGATVNVETDVLAKYVARQLENTTAGTGPIDEAFLAKTGFMR
jgi:riboflavin synthase